MQHILKYEFTFPPKQAFEFIETIRLLFWLSVYVDKLLIVSQNKCGYVMVKNSFQINCIFLALLFKSDLVTIS